MMMERLRTAIMLGIVSLSAARVEAQTIVKPSKAPPEADLHANIQRLGDSDFGTRAAAQDAMKKAATYRERGKLTAEWSATADDEIRSRLYEHLVAMELRLISDPPPISVEFKHAEISEVAQALADALGEDVGWWRWSDPKNPVTAPFATYTLSMKDKPLWEVIDALAQQHPLALGDRGAFILQENPSFHATRAIKAGGVGIFLMDSRTPDQIPQFQFAIDPRIKVTRFAVPQWSLVTDELGNTLMTDRGNPDPPWWAPDTRGMHVWNSGGPAYSLAKAGAKEIASAKGTVRFSMQIGFQSVSVVDAQKVIDQPLQIAGKTITIKSIQMADNRLTADIVYLRAASLPVPTPVSDAEKARYAAARMKPELFEWRNPDPVTLRMIDAAGKVALSYSITRNAHITRVFSADVKPPLTLEFSSFLEPREQSVPFEVAHIPIPVRGNAAQP